MRSANLFFFTQPQETFEDWYQTQQNTPFEEKVEQFFVEFQQIPINYGTTTDTSYQDSLYWKEQHLYGSSRLGIAKPELEVTNFKNFNFSLLTSNFKNYELTNHLGNILATIKDEKQQIDQNADGIVDYYEPIVITANDYYPFGMIMPNRSFSLAGSGYRFGYQGSEKDNEIYGEGNAINTHFRFEDVRLGRWFSTDPKEREQPYQSPYSAMDNNPILNNDILGDIVDLSGMNKEQLESYNTTLKILNKSDLFKAYYSELENSKSTYKVVYNSELNKGGQFNPNNNTVTIGSKSSSVIAQELFHAYQKDAGVYDINKDRSVIETEGDIMTQYVANEAGLPLGGMLAEQGETWGKDIFKVNGTKYDNPTNEQVQSKDYDKKFTKAVDERIKHFKNKNKDSKSDAYKGYTTPNSGSAPKATKKVFEKVAKSKEPKK